jgi:hypothetical protein
MRITQLVIVAIVISVGYQIYSSGTKPATISAPAVQSSPGTSRESAGPFRCDGRIHCSQMTSCAEATYVLKNCPGTKARSPSALLVRIGRQGQGGIPKADQRCCYSPSNAPRLWFETGRVAFFARRGFSPFVICDLCQSHVATSFPNDPLSRTRIRTQRGGNVMAAFHFRVLYFHLLLTPHQ